MVSLFNGDAEKAKFNSDADDVQFIDNVIFFSGKLNIRGGGPAGYIANLKMGIEKYGADNIHFICGDEDKNTQNKMKYKTIIKCLTFWLPVKKIRKKTKEKLLEIFNRKSAWYRTDIASDNYASFVKRLDKYIPKTITCHWVKDALFIKNYVNNRKLKTKVIVMSHSPEPPSQEVYHRECLAGDCNAERNLKIWQDIEKKAFYSADMLLFPSKEATEPYTSALSYFNDLIQHKKMLYLNTGCSALQTNKEKEELRRQYNITTPFVICYIGRHTHIKGYDILKDIAQDILSKRDDVTFLIGGIIDKEIKTLSHPRWIELGFVNPAEVFAVSDLFILPNRQTYFDLVLLEALSAGCPVLASETGGNKSVYETTKLNLKGGRNAVELWSSPDECVEKVMSFLSMSDNEKENIRTRAHNVYQKYYTIDVFAKNYIKLIKEITNEQD